MSDNPLVPLRTLRRIHSLMLRCRAEAQASSLSRGREALAAASIVQLQARDWIFCSHADVSVLTARALTQTADEQNVVADLGPTARVAAAIGAAIPVQVEQADPTGNETVLAFTRARVLESRSLQRALQLTADRKLPLLLFVESRDDHDVPDRRSLPLPLITVDRGDAIAVFRVVQESLDRARRGVGPTLIDCRILPGQDSFAHLEEYIRSRSGA